MTRLEYDKVSAMNFSRLIHGRESMAHLKWIVDHPLERTDDMLVGIAWHLALFEPGDFQKRILIFHGKTRRGLEWDQCVFEAEKVHGYALTEAQHKTVCEMAESVKRNEQAKALLESEGRGEFSIQWKDADSGIDCKGILDRLCMLEYGGISQPWIIDGKSCQSTDKRRLKYLINDYGYHVQAAMYLDGANAMAEPCERRFAWIFQEKSPPYDAVVYEASEGQISEGRRIYKGLLEQVKQCRETGRWPGRQDLKATDALEQVE